MLWITCKITKIKYLESRFKNGKNEGFLFFPHFREKNKMRCWPAYRIIQTREKKKKKKTDKHTASASFLTYRIRMNPHLKWIQKQWIKKYINWNTIAVVYAFKLVYNKQTIAYFSFRLHTYIYTCFDALFPKKWRYYSLYMPSLPICLFLSQFISYLHLVLRTNCIVLLQWIRKKIIYLFESLFNSHFCCSKFEPTSAFRMHIFLQLKKSLDFFSSPIFVRSFLLASIVCAIAQSEGTSILWQEPVAYQDCDKSFFNGMFNMNTDTDNPHTIAHVYSTIDFCKQNWTQPH